MNDDLSKVGFKPEDIRRMIETAYFSKDSQKSTPVPPWYQSKPPEQPRDGRGVLHQFSQ